MSGPDGGRGRWLRLRTEVRDLIEVVLVPGVAAFLPWTLSFRLFKLFARWQWLYREATDRSLAQAMELGWVQNPAEWASARRLVTLVDHADFYLARSRSDTWMRRHVDVQGTWDTAAPQVMCTFHWGAGMWAQRHMRASGLDAHMLVANPDGARFAGRRIFYHYIKARIAQIVSSLGNPTLDPLQDLRRLVAAARTDGQIVAVIDVPSDQVSASVPVQIAGRTALVPRGLLKMAIDQRMPVSVFLTGIDLQTGRRSLRIHNLGVHADMETLFASVFVHLDRAIREEPAAWHFWSESKRFFGPAEP